jgi:hypothetical protein
MRDRQRFPAVDEEGLGDRKIEPAGPAGGRLPRRDRRHDGLPSIPSAPVFAAVADKLSRCRLLQNSAAKKQSVEGLVFPLKAGNKPSKDG